MKIMYTLMLVALLGIFSGIAAAEKTATVPNEGSVVLIDENGVTAVANANDTLKVNIPDPIVKVDFYKDAENKTYLVGDVVDYRYYAKNAGNVDITGIVVTDDMLGQITMSATSMKPGDEIVGSKAMTVKDSMAGTAVTNFVKLTGTANGEPVLVNGSATVLVADFLPEIELTKKFSVEEAEVGDTVQVTLTAKNVGKISGMVSISDPMIDGGKKLVLNDANETSVELTPGESVSVTRDYVVSEKDLKDITVVEK